MPNDDNDQLPLSPGQSVLVQGIRTIGEIVAGPDSRDQFSVIIGHLTIVVPRDKITLAGKARLKQTRTKPSKIVNQGNITTSKVPLRVDLHGHTIETALESLTKTIDQALLSGTDQIVIIHGKGTGTLKQAIHEFLAKLNVIKNFKLEDHNPGITRAYL